jgi:hypothetical protein
MQRSCLPVSVDQPSGDPSTWTPEEYLRIVRDEAQTCSSTAVASSTTTAATTTTIKPDRVIQKFDPLDTACPGWIYAMTERSAQAQAATDNSSSRLDYYASGMLDYHTISRRDWVDDFMDSFQQTRTVAHAVLSAYTYLT